MASGADLVVQLYVPGGPRRSEGVPGVRFGRKSLESRAEQLRPDCIQIPSNAGLEVVFGADAPCTSSCGAGPGDLPGVLGGSNSAEDHWKAGPKISSQVSGTQLDHQA